MGHGVHMQELPGIGKRYDIDLGNVDERISVIVRNDRTRYLYVFATRSDEPTAVIELSEEQARKLGALLAGTFFEG
jgi:TrkA domain protein